MGGEFYFGTTGENYFGIDTVLYQCKKVLDSDATFTWVGDSLLLTHNIVPYQQMPLWLPGILNNLHTINVSKALDRGLTFRPLEQTIRDTHAWDSMRTDVERRRALSGGRTQIALAPRPEQALLRNWHARTDR